MAFFQARTRLLPVSATYKTGRRTGGIDRDAGGRIETAADREIRIDLSLTTSCSGGLMPGVRPGDPPHGTAISTICAPLNGRESQRQK